MLISTKLCKISCVCCFIAMIKVITSVKLIMCLLVLQLRFLVQWICVCTSFMLNINLCTVEFTCIIIVWNEFPKVACQEKFDNLILCCFYWFCSWLWLGQNFAGIDVHYKWPLLKSRVTRRILPLLFLAYLWNY